MTANIITFFIVFDFMFQVYYDSNLFPEDEDWMNPGNFKALFLKKTYMRLCKYLSFWLMKVRDVNGSRI